MVPYTYSFCRRCDSRVELGRIAYGATVACPACGSEFVIESPAQSRDRAGEGRGEEKLAQATAPLFAPAKMGLSPLPQLFLSGTFTFPFRLRVLWQTLTLATGAAALFGAFRLGWWCASVDNEALDRATRILLWNGLLLSITFGAVALPAWVYVASAYGMTVLRETSCGADAVDDWPNVLALEDSSQCFYVVNGALLALLPGALAAPLWSSLRVPIPLGIGGGAALLFPVLLLSMLIANSPAHLLSLRVCRGLVHGAAGWIGFHLATLAAGCAVAVLEIALWRRAGWATDVALTGIVAAAAWIVYFRLAGRLAWFHSLREAGIMS
jgi:hypothetical protein